MAANFVFGLVLALFYDTWLIAVLVGGLAITAYLLPKYLLPNSSLYQFVGSAVTAVFAAQFIYQMHGLFEMHFWVFIASLALVAYQRWTLQLPLIILVVIHHAVFAYLQYTGMKDIYFTQLDYMSLSTFLFHGGLAAVAVMLSGYWSFNFRKATISNYFNTLNLQKQVVNMQQNIAFAEDISKGNLHAAYELDDDDKIGKSLMDMRSGLVLASEREHQDKFNNVGLAQISEILRNNLNEVESLCDQVLFKIVKYLDANQGALFIVEDEGTQQVHLNLKACYAFDRKKTINKQILPGQGLLGQVYLEKASNYITEVPAQYVTISSGLGHANPRSLIMFPLKVNEEVVGVVELALFRTLMPYEISFLEKIGESIASTILSVKINERTQQLLEQTRIQAEEMRAQEEEMRQNMEELAATQEEMNRKELEMRDMLDRTLESEENLKKELETFRKAAKM